MLFDCAELSIIDPPSGSDQSLSASAVGGGAPPAQTGPESPRSSSQLLPSAAVVSGGATSSQIVVHPQSSDPESSAMIMDGLETMSFGEANVHFHHLLNFETFKAEMPDDSANVAGLGRIRSDANNINDSLNTPGISNFMDLPIFSFGPSAVLPTLPSVFSGKNFVIKIATSPSRPSA